MYDKNEIIKWLVSKKNMSPKKIQKMLYYIYAWGLVILNEQEDELEHRVFNGNFEAWVHGPVDREVYLKLRKHGYQDISYSGPTAEFDEETLDILNQVFEVYSDYSANELESITHQEEPWLTARKGLQPFEGTDRPISDQDIFRYYAAQLG